MPVAPKAVAGPTHFLAWSFSRLNDYRKCPKQAFYKHIKKIAEKTTSPALIRGSAIHEMCQTFAQKTAKTKCPAELATFEAEFRVLQKHRATLACEQQVAFDKNWNKVDWFDKAAWCRQIIDAWYMPIVGKKQRLVIIDYKTGKLNDDHLEQLSLYALSGLLLFPGVDEVEVQLWYLDQGVQRPDVPKIYTAKDVPELKKLWEKNVASLLKDRAFKEKPGKACTWCAFSKGKGGPCKY